MEDYKENNVFPKVFQPISYGVGLPGSDPFLDHNHDGINSKLLHPQAGFPDAGPKSATFIIGPSSNSDSDTYDYVTDGTADEVQIQAAIDALPSTGGRIVFREGTYTLSAVVTIAKDGVTLQGQGKGSIITLVAAANNVSFFKLGHASTTYKNCVIRDFYLDGNGSSATGTTSYIIDNSTLAASMENVLITGCYFTNAENAAIVSDASITITNNWFVNNNGASLTGAGSFVIHLDVVTHPVIIDSNHFSEDTRTGIGFIGPSGSKVHISNNTFETTSNVNASLIKGVNFVTNNFFYLRSGTLGSSFIAIEGCGQVIGNRFGDGAITFNVASVAVKNCNYIADNLISGGVGVHITNTNSRIIGNEISTNGDAIKIDDTPCTIMGNRLRPGLTANNTYNGITLNGDDPCTIQGNIIEDNTNGNNLQYGIRETGTGVGPNIIIGNYITDVDTSFISTQNPSTEVSHNITV
jgi:hypothetical protein